MLVREPVARCEPGAPLDHHLKESSAFNSRNDLANVVKISTLKCHRARIDFVYSENGADDEFTS